MDVLKKLIEEAKQARFRIAELAGEYEHDPCGCTYCRLKPAIAAAERAVDKMDENDEALRLADVLSTDVLLWNQVGPESKPEIRKKMVMEACDYRQVRGLGKGKPCGS